MLRSESNQPRRSSSVNSAGAAAASALRSHSPRSMYSPSTAGTLRWKSSSFAIPVAAPCNDVRCCAIGQFGDAAPPQSSAAMLDTANPSLLTLLTGGKNGVLEQRSAVSAVPTQSEALSMAAEVGRRHGTTVTTICVTPRQHVWCGYAEGHIRVYDISRRHHEKTLNEIPTIDDDCECGPTRMILEARHHNASINMIVCSMDSSTAAATARDSPTMKASCNHGGGSIPPSVFSCGADWKILRWSMDFPFAVAGLVGTHSLSVRCLCITPKVLVSGGDDHVVKVWPFHLLEKRQAIIGHTAAVVCLYVNNGVLFSGSEDCTVRLWNLEGDRSCIRTLVGHQSHVVEIMMNEKGLLYTADKEGIILVWETTNFEVVHCFRQTAFASPPKGPSKREMSGRGAVKSKPPHKTNSPVSAAPSNPLFIHDVKFIAHLNGLLAWVMSTDGARLSLLPDHPLEEELERRFGPFDGAEGGGLDGGSSIENSLAVAQLRQSLEQAEQREKRQYDALQDLQLERDEFASFVYAAMEEVVSFAQELFHECDGRKTALNRSSWNAVRSDTSRHLNELHRKIQQLEAEAVEREGKLLEKSKQLAGAQNKYSQQLSAKAEEGTNLALELQRAQNDLRRANFELNNLKEVNAMYETTMKKHAKEAGTSAANAAELVRVRQELTMAKETVDKMHAEAAKRDVEAKRRAEFLSSLAERQGDEAVRVLRAEIDVARSDADRTAKEAATLRVSLREAENTIQRLEQSLAEKSVDGSTSEQTMNECITLRQSLRQAEAAIQELKTTVDKKDSRIAQLQRDMQTAGSKSQPKSPVASKAPAAAAAQKAAAAAANEEMAEENAALKQTLRNAEAKIQSLERTVARPSAVEDLPESMAGTQVFIEENEALKQTLRGAEETINELRRAAMEKEKESKETSGAPSSRVADRTRGKTVAETRSAKEVAALQHSLQHSLQEAEAKIQALQTALTDKEAKTALVTQMPSSDHAAAFTLPQGIFSDELISQVISYKNSRSLSHGGGAAAAVRGDESDLEVLTWFVKMFRALQQALTEQHPADASQRQLEGEHQELQSQYDEKCKQLAECLHKNETERAKIQQLQAAVNALKDRIASAAASTELAEAQETIHRLDVKLEEKSSELRAAEDRARAADDAAESTRNALMELEAVCKDKVQRLVQLETQVHELQIDVDCYKRKLQAAQDASEEETRRKNDQREREKVSLLAELRRAVRDRSMEDADVDQTDELSRLQELSLRLGGSAPEEGTDLSTRLNEPTALGDFVPPDNDLVEALRGVVCDDAATAGLVAELVGPRQRRKREIGETLAEGLGGSGGADIQNTADFTALVAYLDDVKNRLHKLEAAARSAQCPALRDGVLVEIHQLHTAMLTRVAEITGQSAPATIQARLPVLSPLFSRHDPVEEQHSIEAASPINQQPVTERSASARSLSKRRLPRWNSDPRVVHRIVTSELKPMVSEEFKGTEGPQRRDDDAADAVDGEIGGVEFDSPLPPMSSAVSRRARSQYVMSSRSPL